METVGAQESGASIGRRQGHRSGDAPRAQLRDETASDQAEGHLEND